MKKPHSRTPPALALARKIARSLFTNGMGHRAERLVLTIDGPPARDLGGWCEAGARDQIWKILAREQAKDR